MSRHPKIDLVAFLLDQPKLMSSLKASAAKVTHVLAYRRRDDEESDQEFESRAAELKEVLKTRHEISEPKLVTEYVSVDTRPLDRPEFRNKILGRLPAMRKDLLPKGFDLRDPRERIEVLTERMDTFSENLVNEQDPNAGWCDLVVFERLDDLGPTTSCIAETIAMIHVAGVHVLILDPVIDTRTDVGRKTITVILRLSRAERNAKGVATKKVHRKKMRERRAYGGIPFGFKSVDGRLVDDPEEMKVVTRIRTMALEQKLLPDAIAAALNRDGLGFRGRSWRKTNVEALIGRDVYEEVRREA